MSNVVTLHVPKDDFAFLEATFQGIVEASENPQDQRMLDLIRQANERKVILII